MQEPADKPLRRWADHKQATPDNIWKILLEIRADLQSMKQDHQNVSEAFIKDDLSKPDYHGHRKAHLDMVREAKVVDTYKQDATKKVIGIIVTFVIGLLVAGFIEAIRK
jgi:hemerythrin